MSNGIHPSNFAGDTKEWPVYMTIGNLSSKIHQMPSMHSIIMVAVLPIPIKNYNIPRMWFGKQQQSNRTVLNYVLQQVLQPVTFKQNPSPESRYYSILCADRNFRRCKPVFAVWLADCPEHTDQYHLEWHVCIWCDCPKDALEHYGPPDNGHSWQDHNLYRIFSDATTKAANAELSSHHVHWRFNFFRHIPYIISRLPDPHLLHTMQIGMLGCLQKWIFHFMKTHQWLDKYNAILLSGPAYYNLTSKNKSYKEFSQCNGKEMKEMRRYLLGVVTQSLRGGCPAQHPLSNRTI